MKATGRNVMKRCGFAGSNLQTKNLSSHEALWRNTNDHAACTARKKGSRDESRT